MSEMGDAVHGPCDAGEEFYSHEDQDEPLGFQGHRREDQRPQIIGIEHCIANLDAIDGS